MMRIAGKICLLLLLFFLAGCKEETTPEAVSTPQLPGPTLSAGLTSLKLKAVFPAENILELQGDNRSLKLVQDSGAAFLDGIPIQLPSPVTVNENVWSVETGIVQNIFRPLLEKRSFPIHRIVLDPGHGGHDQGAVSAGGIQEKTLNLQLSLVLAEELQKLGFEVILTREDDRFLTLDERPEVAAKKQADLFLSIHHNASTNPEAAGMEIFLLKSENEEESSKLLSSWHPAFVIAKELTFGGFTTARGVKTARFKVLRLAKMPALLLEAGFVSNPEEVKKLADPVHQRVFAKLAARAISSLAATGRSGTSSF